ncbi:DUF2285 domain-containing protein [Stigmatella sp. ncwal1]|uniref:DUF2285 domain-containing protein n=1 Tax=Stigmatella ashevillensis TaxID=2995309 RepID=A0ABT5DP14_9BACT|nr:DUF2285 domain-containing protein [Stigmatella ashevillena]MDC0714804.1 DUF2285 domain-containing protein [Stigmatella ashevillena]
MDPSLDAWSTSVFWASGALPRLNARIQTGPASMRGFWLDRLQCQKSLLLGPEGGTLMFTGNGETVALECEGEVEALLSPGAAFVLWVPGPQDLEGAISALDDFRTLLGPGMQEPLPRSKQLQSYLIALDAERAGASYRDIAILLYGEAAAAKHWRDPARHMKDAVRYAVRRGWALMEGGYRRLLLKRLAGPA